MAQKLKEKTATRRSKRLSNITQVGPAPRAAFMATDPNGRGGIELDGETLEKHLVLSDGLTQTEKDLVNRELTTTNFSTTERVRDARQAKEAKRKLRIGNS